MIAVTIFGIVSIAVYSTFRVGMKSYEQGREQMLVTQMGRGVFDLISRDLRGIYYLPPNAYNQNLVRQLQFRAMRNLQTPDMPGANTRRQRQAMRNLRGDRAGEGEDEEPLTGIPINLTILGSSGEGGDALTFVTYQVHWGTAPVEPWALARVKYFVENGNLFRAEGPIWVDAVPSFQWQPPRSPEEDEEEEENGEQPTSDDDIAGYLKDAPRELIARNVQEFDIQYGYWNEEGWFETSSWTAHQQRHRNPPPELDLFDVSDTTLASMNMARMQHQRRMSTDDIPAYVTVTLKLGYGDDESHGRLFRSKIRLLTSTETYEPFIDPSLNLGQLPPTAAGGRSTPFGRR